MLKPGVYVIGRKIDGADFATHQYIVLVPSERSVLPVAKTIGSMHYAILGAYHVDGFLRARAFAESDHEHFRALKHAVGPGIQSANFVVCWISTDLPVRRIFTAYEKYRKNEGQLNEIRYPETPRSQLKSDRYNSNSWAQSCIIWAAGNTIRSENDLPGLDIGRERRIPEKFFV